MSINLNRRQFGLGALASGLVLANSAGASRAADLLPVKMAIGGLSWVPYAPVVLAKQMGLFEKHGIDLNLFNIADGGATLQAVVTKSADLGCGYFDHTTELASKQKPATAIALETRLPGIALFVTPKFESQINSAADLIGKPVGSSALGGLTSSRNMLNRYLRINKVDGDKVPVVLVGGPETTLAAIERGDAVAIVTGEPSITMVQQRIGRPLKMLFDTRTVEGTQAFYGSDYPSGTVYGLTPWIEAHPKESQGVTSAIVEALAYIRTHAPEDVVSHMPDDIKGSNAALYLAVFKNMLQIFSPDGRFSPASAKVAVDNLSAANADIANAHIDPTLLYTNQFADIANQQLATAS